MIVGKPMYQDYHIDLENIYDKYYVGLYGVNRSLEEVLRKFSDTSVDGSSIVFYEYLLHQPIPFVKGLTGDSKIDNKIKDLVGHIYLLAPFATRMVETHNIVPAMNKDNNGNNKWGLGYRSKKSLSDVKLFFKFFGSLFTKTSYTQMAAEIFVGEYVTDAIKMTSRSIDTTEGKAYYAQIVFNPQKAIKQYKESHQIDKQSLKSVEILEQPFKIIFPNHFYNKKKIYGLVVPIASNKYFYGCLWLMCFREKRDEEYERNLVKAVLEIVSSHYVPVMALLHENISEELLEQKFSKKLNTSTFPHKEHKYCIPFLQVIAGGLNKHISGKPEIIEEGLENLCRKRFEMSNKKYKKNIYAQMILKTLLFKNYRVASQTMVKLIRDIIKAAGSMKKSGSSLPAALVIGGAGSGKDTIGKMLRIFTNSYFEGEEYTINLAAIKPSALVPAVMTGAEFNIFKEMKFDDYMNKNASKAQFFEGLFQKIRKGIIGSAVPEKNGMVKKIKQFTKVEKDKEEKDRFKKYPTLILDEFNSMDSESQGVLLRFLENSEAVSLGSLRNGSEFEEAQDDMELVSSLTELTNCLVIGVMNEDPDDISKERAMDFLKEDSYLGGLLGDILYEHFIKIRRLRPDIKYRMMRNGRFVIEPLKDRREDIPILFHVYLKPENEGKKIPVHLSLEAMERLISKDITWPGNIRQLQALAKHVSELVQAETKYNIKAVKDIGVAIVEKKHIDIGLDYIGIKITA